MDEKEDAITVSGVTFTAEQVKSAVVTIDKRDIVISEVDKSRLAGFHPKE